MPSGKTRERREQKQNGQVERASKGRGKEGSKRRERGFERRDREEKENLLMVQGQACTIQHPLRMDRTYTASQREFWEPQRQY